MGELRLPGLVTGIDTNTLISQLMLLERRTLNQYQVRQSFWNERKDALGSLESKLDALRTTVHDLSDARTLRAFTTVSSNTDILTAEASHNAFEGNHTIVVNQLANAERWVHTAGKEYVEDYVGAGTFIYSYNNKESIITTTADTTLEDLAGLINNDAQNPGVTANLLYYNDAYHLVLNGNDAGSDYEISINASNTEVWQSTSSFTLNGENAAVTDKLISLDQFEGTLAGDESITISGTRHDGTAFSETLAINENTKLSHIIGEINDAFAGTATATLVNGQIRLTDGTSGASQMQLSLTYNVGSGSTVLDIPALAQSTQGGSVTASLAGFATADFTETQSAQDSQIRVDGYPAGDGEWITRSSNTIDNVIQGLTLHLHDTGTVQVNLTRDVESVKEKLDAMVTAYNAAVAFLREKTGYNAARKTGGTLMGDPTVRSIADELRMPLVRQTSGFALDVDRFLMPGQIGLELDRNGMLILNSNAFDEAIANNYLGVLAVIGADKTGGSDNNRIEFYGASSNYTTAGAYDVEVTIVGGTITSARIKLDSETTWRNATFDGNVVTGDSTFLAGGRPAHPENGLQLSVDLSLDGTFTANVRVKQGFAGAMEDALDRMLQMPAGTLTLDQKQVEDQLKYLADRIQVEEQRLAQREARLVARYARLEKTLAALQSQMAALGLG